MNTLSAPPELPSFVTQRIDLALPRVGACALAASDEFFAPKERLLDPRSPVFISIPDGGASRLRRWGHRATR